MRCFVNKLHQCKVYINNSKFTYVITTRLHRDYLYSVVIHVMGYVIPVIGVSFLWHTSRGRNDGKWCAIQRFQEIQTFGEFLVN